MNEPTTPMDRDGRMFVADKLADLRGAIAGRDHAATARVLRLLAAEVGPEFAQSVIASVTEAALTRLLKAFAAGDPGATAILRDLLAQPNHRQEQ